MADAYGELGSRPGGNHPRSSMQDGASAVATPSNNASGGSGWGDKGFFKGGTEGPGHHNTTNARSTIGGFLPLQQQKGIAGSHFEQRAESANMDRSPPSGATCETEDHSFMEHKPGCSGGLPGAATAKDTVLETLHGQRR